MWDIGSGLSALIGAVVGGTATFAGTWLNVKHQGRQAVQARREERINRRYAVHQQMVTATFAFGEITRKVAYDYHDDRSAMPADLVQRYHNAWEEFQVAQAGALLAGPAALNESLRALDDAASAYSGTVDKLLSGTRTQKPDGQRDAFWISTNKYIADAREAYDGDLMPQK
ncbi:hypothetical protein [Rhodococcus sp. NPDC004095]